MNEISASGKSVMDDVADSNARDIAARQAQSIDALGRLAGRLAHDFNNLLTVVFGNIDLARREVRDRPSTIELLDEMERAANRAADLTRQLQSFSRKRLVDPQPVSLDLMVQHASRKFPRLLPDGIALHIQLASHPHVVRSDAAQLEQALMNLIVNARDVLLDGGEIVVETAIVDVTTPMHLRDGDVPAGRYATLSVRDNGPGISEDVRARVFEPFFTTRPSSRGTGLGLTMVYNIATLSGGSVHVESEPGHGARFTLYLPVTHGSSLPDETARH